MSETKINASIAEKLKRTRTNTQNSSAPDIIGIALGDFHVDSKRKVPSGEADIYLSFPANFPPRLKDLVLGLTYKDLSNRHEKDNPNRRWGYDEVRRWLRGEDVPVPGESAASESKPKFLPYSFGGVKHQTLESLVKAMLKDPAAGIREAGRGILTHHFSLFAPDLERICREAEANLQKNTDAAGSHQVFYRLMYRLAPKLKTIFCGGREFGSLAELLGYLKKLESEKGFSGYIRYIEEHREDLEFFAFAIPEAKSREALKLVLEDLDRAVFGEGELQFKNARAFDEYAGRLLREKQTYRLRHLLNTYDAALKEVSEKVWHSSSYDNLRRTVSGFVMLGGAYLHIRALSGYQI